MGSSEPVMGEGPRVAPYGSWSSPIAAERIAAGSIGLGGARFGAAGEILWLESRPNEGGRSVIVRRAPSGELKDAVPGWFNARTRVHEYGGGAWLLAGDAIVSSNFDDQRLYRIERDGEPVAITPEPSERASVRFADGDYAAERGLIIAVRETHRGRDVVNELVALRGDGTSEPEVIAGGRDFYSNPRISPDGSRLAWLEWSHPQMPWDGTELWVADLGSGGDARLVAGSPEESIWQPAWSPSGELHYASDRSGWWNLYREDATPVHREEAEFGYPHWLFGGSTYAFVSAEEIACIRTERAEERLCLIRDGAIEELELPFTSFAWPSLSVRERSLLFTAASPASADAIVEVDLDSGEQSILRESVAEPIDRGAISLPRAIEFPTTGDRSAHGFYYPPANAAYRGPDAERPPLIVEIHGGPTAHTRAGIDLKILYWTSRGFGVVDVNYGGSTGYGREYRERLRGRWGVVDTDDCIAAARHLAEAGEVDADRLAIHGGSAGGYTTLCALAFHDVFAAGASYFGVADAETLAADTHKFESRYLDGLIGPYPEQADLYRERSPIHRVDEIEAPVIILQGLEDEVVPPAQAEEIVAALKRNQTPHAYLAFEGEQHGFRRAESIIRALEAELYFYGRVFGFEPADEIEPVEVEFLS